VRYPVERGIENDTMQEVLKAGAENTGSAIFHDPICPENQGNAGNSGTVISFELR
jgi:hypothetical protein